MGRRGDSVKKNVQHRTSNGKNKEHLKVACEEPFGCEFRFDRLSRVDSGIQTSALRGHASQRSLIEKRIRGRLVIPLRSKNWVCVNFILRDLLF